MEGKGKTKFLKILLTAFSAYFLLLSCHTELSSSQDLKTYGESCDADCDERQLLICSQNTSICECMLPSAMVYDQNRVRCVAKAGHQCVRYANEVYCTQHASCDKTTSTCNCDKGYFKTENGTCLAVAKYGESCSSKRPCDRNFGMVCSEKLSSSSKSKRTCQCMFPSDQYYDSITKSCVSYAGGNCSFSLPCVRNADCLEDIYELRRGENIHGKTYTYNVTVGRKCACREGFRQTKDRKCLPSYRQQCDLESSSSSSSVQHDDDVSRRACNPEENLKCFDSFICLCKSPLSQIYDWKLHKCVNLVSAKCSPTRRSEEGDADESADGAPCISNSECNIATGRCECKSGFTSTPFLTCLKDFGAECGHYRDVGSSGKTDHEGACNIHRALSCHQSRGTCGCIDDTLKYDTNTKTCLSEEGGPCGTFEYSDKTGFSLGGGGILEEDSRNGVAMMVRGNHKTGVVVMNQGNIASNSCTYSTIPSRHVSGISQDKVVHTLTKIHIKCTTGLECANEFGEMTSENHDGIFQGFCRYKM